MYFDSINDLKNGFSSSIPLNCKYIVAGYYQEGDGGDGTFVWVPITTSPLKNDDYGIIIRTDPSSPGYIKGYFKRLYSGPINVRWFGAKGDGVTDDTAAVHAARDSSAFANNGTLYFPKGTYKGAFEFEYKDANHNEIKIIGDGQGTILKPNGQIRLVEVL